MSPLMARCRRNFISAMVVIRGKSGPDGDGDFSVDFEPLRPIGAHVQLSAAAGPAVLLEHWLVFSS
jgi:hypothetical protein